jgi:MFS family permease
LEWLEQARRTTGLFAAAFTASIANGILLVALQFRCDELGGNAPEIGALGGIIQIAYLAGCLFFGPWVGRFNLKYLAAAGTACLSCTAVGMSLAPNLTVFLSLAGAHGLVTCLLWPPIMGWLSTGVEGQELSKRLGKYNLSWSSGLVIGPSVGGYLYEHGAAFPVAVGGMAAAFLLLCAMVSPRRAEPAAEAAGPGKAESPTRPDAPDDFERRRAGFFLVLGRTANLFVYLGSGVLRYQLLPLAQALSIDKPTFGHIMTGMSLTLALAFAALSRATWWHYRFGALFAVQAAMAASIAALYFVEQPWQVAAAAVLGGGCMSLAYYSSIYYSAAGGKSRAGAMAVHEVVLSIGFAVGAVGGGWVSELVGLRATYVVTAGIMIAGAVLQSILYLRAGSATSAANNPVIHELPRPVPPIHNQPARKAG